MTAIFTGMRASGLRWADVDLKKGEVHIKRRADQYNKIDNPKSEAGDRVIPVTPIVLNTLREWKLKCPKGPLDLVFPNGAGNIEQPNNIAARGLSRAQVAAGVVDENGKARYGLCSLKHFYASWSINRRVGGRVAPKPAGKVGTQLDHANVKCLRAFVPARRRQSVLAEAERLLLG
jgi:integrase